MENHEQKLTQINSPQNKKLHFDFISFLNTKKTWDTKNYTHTMLFPNGAKFNIDKTSFETFWEMYGNHVKKEQIGLTELPQLYAQVVVDIDISLPFKNQSLEENFYSFKHVKTVVEIYQNVLKELVENVTDDQLACLVLTKKPYIKKGAISNGFHLQFPNLFLSQKHQEIFLIPKIKLNLKDSNIFEDIGIADSSSVVDSMYKKTWLLYGSVKGEGMEPYKLNCAYIYTKEKTVNVPVNDVLLNCSIYDSNEKEIELTKDNIEFYIPSILSIFPFGRKTNEIIVNSFKDIRRLLPTKKTFALINGDGENNNKNKKYAEVPYARSMKDLRAIVMMLDIKRSIDYNLWFEIGAIIYNVSNGSREGLDIWLDFSKRCAEKFDEQSCYFTWNRYYVGNLSIGTLIFYVKQDNPKAYKQYRESETRSFISNMSATHYDVADFLHKQFREIYVCSEIKQNEWYKYENHCWNKCEEGYSLILQIPKMLYKKLFEIKKIIKKSIESMSKKKPKHDSDNEDSDNEEYELEEEDSSEDEETEKEKDKEKEKKQEHLKHVSKLMNQLKMAPFVKSVMHFAKILFFDAHFHKKLNSHKHLFGVQNGVLDAKQGIFREGKPDDYISTQATFEYKTYDKNDPEVTQVRKYLEQVFPNPNIREYFLNRQSQIFMGGNLQKVIEIWSGDRDNAKSTTVKILEYLLGRYSAKLPSSLGTGERPAGGSANPELARLGEGARKMFMQEPSGKKKFNVAVLKELAGNDTMFARFLHKNGGEITIQADLVIVCNKIPSLDAVDAAIIKRLKVIPFESTFTEDAPESKEEQMMTKVFPVDRTLESRLHEFVPAFAWILFEHWNGIKDKLNTFLEPKEVRQATDAYIEDNDFFKRFFVGHTEKTKSQNDRISVSEFYSMFKDWMKDSFSTIYSCDKYEFKKCMNKLFEHDAVKNTWYGFKIINEDGESSEPAKKKFISSEQKTSKNPMLAQVQEDDEEEIPIKKVNITVEPELEITQVQSTEPILEDCDEYNEKPKRFLINRKNN